MYEPQLRDEICNIQYSDIYGTQNEQIKAAKFWNKLFKIRNWKLETRKLSTGHQEHQAEQAESASSSCNTVDPSPLDIGFPSYPLLYDFDLGY